VYLNLRHQILYAFTVLALLSNATLYNTCLSMVLRKRVKIKVLVELPIQTCVCACVCVCVCAKYWIDMKTLQNQSILHWNKSLLIQYYWMSLMQVLSWRATYIIHFWELTLSHHRALSVSFPFLMQYLFVCHWFGQNFVFCATYRVYYIPKLTFKIEKTQQHNTENCGYLLFNRTWPIYRKRITYVITMNMS